MAKIRVAALDGALANFGIAKLDYDTETGVLTPVELKLVETSPDKTKTVRKSSDRLRRAQEIADALRDNLTDCVVAFIEVPSGGQSADAVYAFGITVGLYASLTIPTVEVSPSETKLATIGTRTASKQEMIEWAAAAFPNAPWLMKTRGGVSSPTLKNEHLADAVAIAHAGIKTPQFRQTASMFRLANK